MPKSYERLIRVFDMPKSCEELIKVWIHLSQTLKKISMPWVRIEPGTLQSKVEHSTTSQKSRLVTQGSTSVFYT